jgi:Ca2+-binding EF-hand superfamily protein
MKKTLLIIALLLAFAPVVNAQDTNAGDTSEAVEFIGSWGAPEEPEYTDGYDAEDVHPFSNRAMNIDKVKEYDTDGDGTLSDTEKTAMHEARKAEMLKKYDTDSDGTLSDSEKEAMKKDMPPMGGRRGPGMNDGKMPQEMLTKYDTDGDGTLSDTEKTAMHEARKAEMLKKYDTDSDGTLSDTEKQTLRESRPGRGERMNGMGKKAGMRKGQRGSN